MIDAVPTPSTRDIHLTQLVQTIKCCKTHTFNYLSFKNETLVFQLSQLVIFIESYVLEYTTVEDVETAF